jgi:hypothetical protein
MGAFFCLLLLPLSHILSSSTNTESETKWGEDDNPTEFEIENFTI